MPGRNHALKANQVPAAAQLYRDGLSRRRVAAHFGVSDMAVRSALALAGVRMRTLSQARQLALRPGAGREAAA